MYPAVQCMTLLLSILESFDTTITIMELEKLATPYPQVIVHFSISLGCKILWEKKDKRPFSFTQVMWPTKAT